MYLKGNALPTDHLFIEKVDIMAVSFLGHQPEWGSEAKNLCGTSSLSKHQYCLLGENTAFTFFSTSFSPSGKMGR